MKIRSITFFINPGWPLKTTSIQQVGLFREGALESYRAAGYDVQSSRLAIVPFPELMRTQSIVESVQFSQELEHAAVVNGFDYVSAGPVFPEQLAYYPHVYEILRATQNVFASASMTTHRGEVSMPAIKACSDIIHKSSTITSDGFGNLYFAALANVPPGIPFFPAAYHGDSDRLHRPVFSLAMESADIVIDSISISENLSGVREALISKVEHEANKLSELARIFASKSGSIFGGIDFTPAPFPTRESSFGTSLERLGVKVVGLHGSLAAAAFIADAIDRAKYQRAGFNGLFFPVLEDKALADSAASGNLSLKDLLLYSTVCGSGLDTIPLPGEIGVDDLYAILLDVAFLALRLNKPLTARLMPVPGKKAGETTEYKFDYFANSKVMTVDSKPIQGLLRGNEVLEIKIKRE